MKLLNRIFHERNLLPFKSIKNTGILSQSFLFFQKMFHSSFQMSLWCSCMKQTFYQGIKCTLIESGMLKEGNG